MKKILVVILAALTFNVSAQRVITTSTTGGVLSQPTGIPAANNLQTYTGTRTNNALARFDGSGNVKSSAVTVGDDGTLTVSGTGAGRAVFSDADGSNHSVIKAADATTTNGNYSLPVAPQSGLWYSILTGSTNAPLSILPHPGSAGLVLISTNSNGYLWGAVSGGGGGTGATNVLVNGVNITQANFTNNYAYTFSVSGSTIRVIPTAPATLTDAATIATDASLSCRYRVTLGASRTLGAPTNPTDGQQAIWEVVQDATGGRTLTADTGTGGFQGNLFVTLPGGDFGIGTNANARSFISAIYTSSVNKWNVLSVSPGL